MTTVVFEHVTKPTHFRGPIKYTITVKTETPHVLDMSGNDWKIMINILQSELLPNTHFKVTHQDDEYDIWTTCESTDRFRFKMLDEEEQTDLITCLRSFMRTIVDNLKITENQTHAPTGLSSTSASTSLGT